MRSLNSNTAMMKVGFTAWIIGWECRAGNFGEGNLGGAAVKPPRLVQDYLLSPLISARTISEV